MVESMNVMKINLLPSGQIHRRRAPGSTIVEVKQALPFFRSHSGMYVHRIRSGAIHFWCGVYSHTSFSMWCGVNLFSSKKHPRSKLMVEPESDAILCATCEGRAIGAGQTDSHQICGRFVKFSPRLHSSP